MDCIKKEKLLIKLYRTFQEKNEYKKLIIHFGDLKSDIMILALEPRIGHYKSSSKVVFRFDEDEEQAKRSRSILIRIFKSLQLSIDDYFWNNIFLVPEELNQSKHAFKRLLLSEILILKPRLILSLGREVNELVNDLVSSYKFDFKVKTKKLYHPAYVLYGYSFKEYLNDWQEIKKIIKVNKNENK